MKFDIEKLMDKRLCELTDEELFVTQWEEKGIEFLDDYYNGELPNFDMTQNEFMKHCTAYGGDWNAMLLSGIRELCPRLYNEIPNSLGSDGNLAFIALNIFIRMLGVYGVREMAV